MFESAHKRIDSCATTCLGCVLLQPLAKGDVQCRSTSPRDQASLLDQVFVSTERYVFHTRLVYTIYV